jgi:hypothetical protein
LNLQTDTTTWLAMTAVTLLWLSSGAGAVLAARHSGRGWRALPLSVFGLAWVAFGANYVLRFVLLASDPALFRATAFPPWLIPARAFTRTWLYLGAYWAAVCAGLALMLLIVPQRLPRLLCRLNALASPSQTSRLDLLCCATVLGLFLLASGQLPGALRTPVGHFCSLWMVPAVLVWHLHFSGRRVGSRRFLYLAPGAIWFSFSPYREHLVGLFLCVALPAVLLKRRLGPVVFVSLTAAVLVGSSVVLYVYRPVRWEGQSWSAASRYADPDLWTAEPAAAPWTRLTTRFHGLDAAALTLWLVPETFPYEERDLPVELLVSALLPRAIYAGKVHVQRGRLFSTGIWAYHEGGGVLERAPAMIAPSMVGDLWSAGGGGGVVAGALAWGCLLGLLECWRRGLAPGPGLALLAVLAFRVAGGIERDFVHAAATVIQLVIVLTITLSVMPLRSAIRARAGPRRAPPLPAATTRPEV